MIDIHSHILPGLDDGAPDMETAVAMARTAFESGTEVMACTPHIFMGLWENDATNIKCAVKSLQQELDARRIGLRLCMGADVHIFPGLLAGLEAGSIPTLGASRYFLLELPRHVALPRIEVLASEVIEAGFVPILTHPERLDFINSHYEVIGKLNARGCLMQVTAGSVVGRFGRRVKQQAMQLIADGRVDIIASDAHNLTTRPPTLVAARKLIAERFGVSEAEAMLSARPAAVLENRLVEPCGMQNRPLPILKESIGNIDGSVALRGKTGQGR